MWNGLCQLDRILRGQTTHLPALREGRFEFPVAGVTFVIVLLAAAYGVCMGCFALFNRPVGYEPVWAQPELLLHAELRANVPQRAWFQRLPLVRLGVAAAVRGLLGAPVVSQVPGVV